MSFSYALISFSLGFDPLFSLAKTLIATENLKFEKVKFERLLNKEDKGIQLEEKKFTQMMELEDKKFQLEVEEKGKDRELVDKQFMLQAEEKQMERHWQREKWEREFLVEGSKRKHEFMMECLKSGKTNIEIENLMKLFF